LDFCSLNFGHYIFFRLLAASMYSVYSEYSYSLFAEHGVIVLGSRYIAFPVAKFSWRFVMYILIE
jgi:hypothetical protein